MIEDDIRANRRKLLTGRVIFLCYIALYSCVVFAPLGAWITILSAVFCFNAEIIRSATGAVPIEEEDFPRLNSAVEDVAIATGREAPFLMLIREDAVNAYSMRSPRHRQDIIFCTEGLARDVHPDELRAVMAHEIAHLKNGDAEVGSLIMPLDAISSYAFHPSLSLFSALPNVLRIAIIVLVVLFLAPLLLFLVGYLLWNVVSSDVFAVILCGLLLPAVAFYLLGTMLSLYWGFTLGKREFQADDTAIEFTRYPEGLIDALLEAGKHNTLPRLIMPVSRPLAGRGG